MDENGRVMEVLDRKPEIRRIKIKQLTPDKDLAQMSEDIVEKCKFIHPSRKEEIEQLLIKLRKYQITNPPKPEVAEAPVKEKDTDLGDKRRDEDSSGRKTREKESRNKERDSRDPDRDRGDRERTGRDKDRSGEPSNVPPEDIYPPAQLEELDDYLELLYHTDRDDGLESQTRGTAMILKLCRQVGNLELLIQNSTLMGALTRVLQEEFKKSLDLTFNILR